MTNFAAALRSRRLRDARSSRAVSPDAPSAFVAGEPALHQGQRYTGRLSGTGACAPRSLRRGPLCACHTPSHTAGVQRTQHPPPSLVSVVARSRPDWPDSGRPEWQSRGGVCSLARLRALRTPSRSPEQQLRKYADGFDDVTDEPIVRSELLSVAGHNIVREVA